MTAQSNLGLDKKKNGIFYTPSEATTILCEWAIRSSDDNVLEPSFGGCGFLNASKKRLLSLNCANPENNLFGCDIDSKAFDYLRGLIETSDIGKRFLHDDFLKLQPDDFSVNGFDSVIGNPPYISHHNMSEDQKTTARNILEASNFKLRFKPSLWAYFVFHSLRFLRKGGRIAWILPGSFLYADYANEIRGLLRQHFLRSLVLILGERIFVAEGTEERSVILLCEGWNEDRVDGTMEMAFAPDLQVMRSIITGWHERSWQGPSCDIRPNLALMTGQNSVSFAELTASPEARRLGSLCKIRIGIVTGANKFFIINKDQASLANIPESSLSFILAKFGDIKSLKLLTSDLKAFKRNNKRCLLVDTSRVSKIEGALKEYLDSFPEEEFKKNKTFDKREHWYYPDDGLMPDAFFPYMQNQGPSILLNTARVTSTNTVHRIFFNDSITEVSKKTIAISILSTFSQLSAEIEGRSYGSGVLKHEPSEVARIALLFPSKIKDETVRETFKKIDTLLRRGMNDQAQDAADQFVLSNYSERAKEFHLKQLRQALAKARSRRFCPSVK